MEKENKRLRLKESIEIADSQHGDQSSRFSYLEITPCLKEAGMIWKIFLNNSDEAHVNDMNDIKKVLTKGIPQQKRGDVWFWLIKQYKLRNKAKYKITRLDISYEELLKQYSIHQHSILLDLGRTYPNHPNFKYQSSKSDSETKSIKYGLGQLALFNVLKAYSILDNEVGYCQGLSFVVGFLLIQGILNLKFSGIKHN
jgi:TBC1 domain family protein 1